MRKDMLKVVQDGHSRGHDGYPRHKERGADLEDLPQRESMRVNRNFYDREPALRCAPLRRFILSQVGKQWHKVHSEIYEKMKVHSYVEKDIRDWLIGYVETHTFLKNGKVYFCSDYTGYGAPNESPIESSLASVYVCPKTGKLLKVPQPEWRRKGRYKRKKHTRIDVDNTHQIHKIAGIWYLVTLNLVPDDFFQYRIDSISQSAFVGKSMDDYPLSITGQIWESSDTYDRWARTKDISNILYGKNAIAVSKKQLNKRELRRYNLHNAS